MPETVNVAIALDPLVAERLADPRNRAIAGQLITRLFAPAPGAPVDALAEAIAAVKAEARGVGLTDAMIDAELAAYNAERRDGDAG